MMRRAIFVFVWLAVASGTPGRGLRPRVFALSGGETTKKALEEVAPKKKKRKKKAVAAPVVSEPEPEEPEPEEEEPEEEEVVVEAPLSIRGAVTVHEVVASIEETGAFHGLTLTSEAAATVGSAFARVHGPRRTRTLVRVEVGEANVLSAVAAANVGIYGSRPTKILAASASEPPVASRVVFAEIKEDIHAAEEEDEEEEEEEEEDLVASELEPYFSSQEEEQTMALFPVRVGEVIKTETKRFKVTHVQGATRDLGEAAVGIGTTVLEMAQEDDAVVSDDDDLATSTKTASYVDLGGCDEVIEALREVVELPLHDPEVFSRLGVDPPKGALVFGPSGCGKSTLVRAAAYESGAYVEVLSGADIAAKKSGDAEEALRAVFQRAETKAPSVVVIDDVDLIAKKRDKAASESEKRLTSQLLTLMDGLRPSSGIVVLAATTKQNDLDPAVRRFGRLDREIELLVPDQAQRFEILQVHSRGVRLANDVDLEAVSKDCHGFVGADLAQVCAEAALACVKDNLLYAGDKVLDGLDAEDDADEDDEIEDDDETLEAAAASWLLKRLSSEDSEDSKGELDDSESSSSVLLVTKDHFARALKSCSPSSLRESVVEVPDVSWDDVGGLEDVKRELKETVEYPVQFASLYEDYGLPPSKGVLFYGPPGCGKTLIAKAVASQCGANFISVKGPELLTMWFGESEANVRSLFDKARAAAPCVLFFDEMDSIAKARSASAAGSDAGDRVMNQILAELDAVGAKNVFVVGATNRPDILDPAVTRPGRLDQLVHIPLPDYDSRKQVFKASLRKAPVEADVDLAQLAAATDGFSGADIAEICQRAAKNAVKADVEAKDGHEVNAITRAHFEEAMARARRSVPDSEIKRYKTFTDSLKTSAKADASMRFTFDNGFVASKTTKSTQDQGDESIKQQQKTPGDDLNLLAGAAALPPE